MSNILKPVVKGLFDALCVVLKETDDMELFKHFLSNVETEDIKELSQDYNSICCNPIITIDNDRCDIEITTSKFQYFGSICLTEGGILYAHQRPI